MDPRFEKFSKKEIVKAIMEMDENNTDTLGIENSECEFCLNGICQNDDMNSGEECDYIGEEYNCPMSYLFLEEDEF